MIHKEKILVIDDELAPRESIRMVLKDHYTVSTANGAFDGFDIMAADPADLVVLDIKMPRMDGITALCKIKEEYPETEVVLLTAYASLDTAREAIRHGAFDYLLKPFDKDDVMSVVKKGLQKKRDRNGIRLERDILMDRATYLEEQVSSVKDNIMTCYDGTVNALILTIDAKDHYTYDHSNRVAALSCSLARELGVPDKIIREIESAASIHDIGKIGIEEGILKKKGRLTPDEYTEIKKHPAIGTRIVQSVPFLEDAVPVILYHHERFDGTGYPEGLRAEQIPLSARIVMVADAVDAMMNSRPYRDALGVGNVMQELRQNSGKQFDPDVAELILAGRVGLS